MIMGGAKTPKMPADPDPRPVAVSDSSDDVQTARREEKKRNSANFSRSKTLIAANDSTLAQSAGKPTILGG